VAEQEAEQRPEELGEKVVDAYELAVQAARSGRAEEAIEILTHEAAQERSGRARFQRRVQLAQICMGARHETIALPILEALVEEIERRNLEQWEAPDMLAHPLVLLYRSMSKLNLSAEERQKVYRRICRLDPVQALACSK
jgi:type VI secretion system protein ImpA